MSAVVVAYVPGSNNWQLILNIWRVLTTVSTEISWAQLTGTSTISYEYHPHSRLIYGENTSKSTAYPTFCLARVPAFVSYTRKNSTTNSQIIYRHDSPTLYLGWARGSVLVSYELTQINNGSRHMMVSHYALVKCTFTRAFFRIIEQAGIRPVWRRIGNWWYLWEQDRHGTLAVSDR